MNQIYFAIPGNEVLAHSLAAKCNAEIGDVVIRHFPDNETYLKINSNVKDKQVYIVCSLNQPDEKLVALYFLSQTAKELGAISICLIAPYLSYMRQDKRFQPGEGITSAYFAKLISSFANSLITIDPHLHRRSSLAEIYSIPTLVLHATGEISNWIKNNIELPVLIGPDSESKQWVTDIALKANAPYLILEKIRRGDTDVEVSVPQIEKYINHTPVLVDDIISTARTMIETIVHLKKTGMKNPVCVGVHGIFAADAYETLKNTGASVITTNTIIHNSNKIDLSNLLFHGVNQLNNQ